MHHIKYCRVRSIARHLLNLRVKISLHNPRRDCQSHPFRREHLILLIEHPLFERIWNLWRDLNSIRSITKETKNHRYRHSKMHGDGVGQNQENYKRRSYQFYFQMSALSYC